MAKCSKLYKSGQGLVELAMSSSNNWFMRSYEQTRFGYGWTKWTPLGQLKEAKRYTCTWENLNGNEISVRQLKLTFDKYDWSVKLSEKRDVEGLRYRLPY